MTSIADDALVGLMGDLLQAIRIDMANVPARVTDDTKLRSEIETEISAVFDRAAEIMTAIGNEMSRRARLASRPN